MARLIFILILLIGSINSTNAQSDSLPIINLESIAISSLRIPTPPRQQPFSIALYTAGTIQQTRQQLSLQEYLTEIPGLFSLNANNYAQDLRIAIRGFGARSAFGIRGVKIVVDGIPETTPDGQGQIDNLNIGSINRIEVLKGPSAALYGNASGGVINIFSQENFDKNYFDAGLTFGSFSMQQYQLSGGFKKNKTKVIVHGTHTRSKGYRNHSALENTNINFRIFQKLSKKSKLNGQLNYANSPVGDDPGGLTLEEVAADRKQARERNVTFAAGESIDQLKMGANYKYKLGENQNLEIYASYQHRNFEGRLPFNFGGWVELQRNYWWQGGHYKWKKKFQNGDNVLQLGYDLAWQADNRQRYRNEEGLKGELTLDQIERFSHAGLYALDHLKWGKWLFTAGLRFDANELTLDDKKLDDEDQSDKRNLPAFNPSVGVNYEMASRMHLYANIRSSFETPALSELSSNPSGEPGFNSALESQRALNYELGMKGLLFEKVDFDLTTFFIDTKNDIIPFFIEIFPTRTFYRNAGSTRRLGTEFWLRWQISRKLRFKVSHTYSHFKYREYNLPQGRADDNQLPGIPQHFATFSINYQSENGLNFRLQHRYIDDLFADDYNQVNVNAYHLTDLSLSYRIRIKSQVATPFFGINNLFNTNYYDNIRLNAFGDRYYETGPGINIYGGLRFRF